MHSNVASLELHKTIYVPLDCEEWTNQLLVTSSLEYCFEINTLDLSHMTYQTCTKIYSQSK